MYCRRNLPYDAMMMMVMMIMMGMRNARQHKWGKKWTIRDRPNTVNIKPSSTMPSQAISNWIIWLKKKNTFHLWSLHIYVLLLLPEHTLKRENFLFLPFYRIESLIDHSQFNRFSFCCSLRLKSACSLIHKEAVAHKIQLPNEWQAKILLQIHRTSVGVSSLRVFSFSLSLLIGTFFSFANPLSELKLNWNNTLVTSYWRQCIG